MKIRIKKEWVLFIIGLSILTFGSRLILLADIGTSGIDATVMGLSKLFGGSLGLWIDIISIILVAIGIILRKSRIEWGPIITSIVLGLLYDIWGIILFNQLKNPEGEFVQGLIFLGGILVAPLGSALYIHAKLSTSCVDYLMLSIKQRFHLSMGASRILIEVAFVALACILGGPIGVGTIMIMLLFGVFLQSYYKGLNKFFQKKKQ